MIFYDIQTGNVILGFPQQENTFGLTPPTVDQIINSWKVLSDRNRETFDVIELPFGAYAQDFAESNGYRVNVELLATLPEDRRGEALEFSYPDPNQPEAPSVFVKALSEQFAELKDEMTATQQAVDFLLMGGM